MGGIVIAQPGVRPGSPINVKEVDMLSEVG